MHQIPFLVEYQPICSLKAAAVVLDCMARITQQFQVVPIKRDFRISKVFVRQINPMMHLVGRLAAAFAQPMLRRAVCLPAPKPAFAVVKLFPGCRIMFSLRHSQIKKRAVTGKEVTMEVPVCRRLSVREKDGLLRAVLIVHLTYNTGNAHKTHKFLRRSKVPDNDHPRRARAAGPADLPRDL